MTGLKMRARRWSGRLPRHLRHVVDIDVTDSPAQAARRRFVVSAVHLIGTALLGASLSTRPGSGRFYSLTFSTAATWAAGSLLSGPLHLGWIEDRDATLRRPVVTPVLTGVTAFGIFYGAARVVRWVPVLDRAVARVLTYADAGSSRMVLATTLANGVGEELFFRGALYTALGDSHPVLSSTAIYTLATTTTRNPALVLAAGVMGSLFGLQRRASGGVQAPLLTHLTWSALMVRFLPPLFRRAREA